MINKYEFVSQRYMVNVKKIIIEAIYRSITKFNIAIKLLTNFVLALL